MSLEIKNVSLLLGDGEQQVKALDNVSATVQSGELIAVAGPSGAGKSSLLAVCGGLRQPTSGTVGIGGVQISTMSPAELTRIRREKIGFVFQLSNLVPSLTSLDQLLMLVHLQGRRPNKADREHARALLDEVDMSHRADRRPNQLSGGERQRVGIARALMTSPEIMLVDEPTSMLDHNRGHAIVELLATRCREHGVATLMVTHDQDMLDVASRVFNILDGKLTEAA